MPAIVAFPHVVDEALRTFGDLFANDAQRRHFAEYLTGLYVAEHKTVSGIQRSFAHTTDQSCLNRFLNEVPWDVQALNQRRLDFLQQEPSTRYSSQGVIPIDNTLIDHSGKCIDDVGWFWDHAEERYKIAHDYLIVNYVCSSGKHYPLDFRCFQKRQQCEADNRPFRDHTQLCQELIDWVCAADIPGDFAFDSYFTNAPILNHIDGKKLASGQGRGYVGSLKFNRKVEYKGRTVKVSTLASEIAAAIRKPFGPAEARQWYFTCTLRLPEVKHRVRVAIIWDQQQDSKARLILVTNRVQWEISRIVRVYRHRWTGTETFHRDGKQQLGMGDCQLRDREGQTRHMYLVLLAYSLLMKQLGQDHAREWALQRLTTIGQACRAIMSETLRTTLEWAIKQVTEKARSMQWVSVQLGLAGVNG